MAPAGIVLSVWLHTGPLQWHPLGRFLDAIVAWLVTLGALGLAFGVNSGRRPILRFLVDTSYWVYLVHYPLLCALQLELARLPWSALPKYLAVVFGTVLIAMSTYFLVVRPTPLARWLGAARPRLDGSGLSPHDERRA
jgi:peptidoglycan/LPS O-acetylase OafA/YrhL